MVRGKLFILLVLGLIMSLSVSCAETTTSTPVVTTSKPSITTSQMSTPSQTTTNPAPGSTSAVPAAPTTALPPTTAAANWWDKLGQPQYGGTITIRANSLQPAFDNSQWSASVMLDYWFEKLWQNSWTVDRNIWPFTLGWTPNEYYMSSLAESWEIPDNQTVIFHLRQGVKFQNKPPVNGREFTSDDVIYHFDRLMGTGSGFTTPNPQFASWVAAVSKATAIDKYTVMIKFKAPVADPINGLSNAAQTFEAREVADQKLIGDWKYAIGTGPWVLTDFVQGASMIMARNPDYWGNDERYPKNRLPYADNLKVLGIPDKATAQAAFRSGKIDILPDQDWQTAKLIKDASPNVQQAELPAGGSHLDLRCDHMPFKDIRVRTALQMAINLPAIAKTYYGGIVDGTPAGAVSPQFKGYAYTYADWPQSLKDEYSYNPAGAKKLMAEAGFPDGFNTNCLAPSNADINLLQIFKAEFADIGVTMDINVLDPTTQGSLVRAGKFDQMTANFIGFTAMTLFSPDMILKGAWSKSISSNFTHNNDPAFDAIIDKINAATDMAAYKQLCFQADKYIIEHHWRIYTFQTASFNMLQPNLHGYSGEADASSFGAGYLWARLWVDQGGK
jgi:peptide/nickel transport system substrate-binding protein